MKNIGNLLNSCRLCSHWVLWFRDLTRSSMRWYHYADQQLPFMARVGPPHGSKIKGKVSCDYNVLTYRLLGKLEAHICLYYGMLNFVKQSMVMTLRTHTDNN